MPSVSTPSPAIPPPLSPHPSPPSHCRGRVPVPRGPLRSRQHRRPVHAREHFPRLGHRHPLGNYHPRRQSILLLPLPVRQHHPGAPSLPFLAAAAAPPFSALTERGFISIFEFCWRLRTHIDRTAAAHVPAVQALGVRAPQRAHFWRVHQPGPIHRQGARHHHHRGRRWRSERVRGACCRAPRPLRTRRLTPCFTFASRAQTDIIAVQRVYYNQTYNFGCASRLSLSLCVHYSEN